MADRFTYIPLIGPFVMIAWGVRDLRPGSLRGRSRKMVLGGAGLLLGVPMLALTVAQIATWQNSVALWERAIQVTQRNYFAHNNLGQAYNDTGRYEEAAEQYAAAIALNPAWPEGYSNLGNALAKLGRIDEALVQLDLALEKKYALTGGAGDEVTGVIHYSKGLVLAEADRRAKAIEELNQALALKPGFAAAHYALGKQLELTGDLPGAMEQYQEAVRLEPGMIPAHNNLAVARFRTGDYRGAWDSVRRCRDLGFEPAAGFLRALGEQMPEPAAN